MDYRSRLLFYTRRSRDLWHVRTIADHRYSGERRQHLHTRVCRLRRGGALQSSTVQLCHRPFGRERLYCYHYYRQRYHAVTSLCEVSHTSNSLCRMTLIVTRYLSAPSVAEKENITWAGQVGFIPQIAILTLISSSEDVGRFIPIRYVTLDSWIVA